MSLVSDAAVAGDDRGGDEAFEMRADDAVSDVHVPHVSGSHSGSLAMNTRLLRVKSRYLRRMRKNLRMLFMSCPSPRCPWSFLFSPLLRQWPIRPASKRWMRPVSSLNLTSSRLVVRVRTVIKKMMMITMHLQNHH